MTQLSVLDLIPARSHQTTADSIASSLSLARAADSLGFTRYWVAEHHNSPAIASTSPSTLIAYFAAHTERIRFGSGGVMLPNHAPLTIAEQFAALEAMYPGRIDLGLGRAPGSDPVTAHMLRRRTTSVDTAESFPQDVQTVAALLGSNRRTTGQPFSEADAPSVTLRIGGQNYRLTAASRITTAPGVWLLGSSNFSASLAADLGMPYVYANHFGQAGITEALELYRTRFQPSDALAAPRTIVTASVSVANTADEAYQAALPQLIMIARSRSGGPLSAQLTIDEAAHADLTTPERETVSDLSRRWLIGTAADVENRIRTLANQHDANEVMLLPMGGAHASDPLSATPSRERALELLSTRFPELETDPRADTHGW